MSNEGESASAPFTDPKPSSERIVQLASRVLAGDILLPRFQRNFVWKRSQILDLLDSIRRNYPIGSFLLWQSKQKLASERTISDLAISDRSPGYPVNYLLDGQQRLSSVCGALYWSGENPTSVWNLAYDLRTEKFIHLNTLEEQVPYIIRLRHLTRASDFFSRTGSLPPEFQEKAKAFFDRFTDYHTATVTLGDMPINDIGPVFERINSTGTKLTVVDLMRAATWTPEFDLVERIDSLLAALKPKLFGTIDRKTALRCVSAAAGFGFSSANMDSLRDLSKPTLATAVESATEAAKRAADFLATEIGVPSEVALPYTNQFAVLTALFEKLPHPNATQFEQIRRWFWRTTFSGYFGGWNTGNMAADYKSVTQFASGRSESIASPAVVPQEGIWGLRSFRSNNATSKMLALMLSHNKPIDLLNGQKIDVGKSLAWNNDKEFHHFFPRAYMKKKAGREDFNLLGNIIMLTSISNIKIGDKAPSEYLSEIRSEVGGEILRERLDSCLISPVAAEAALRDDYDAFIKARSERLQEVAMGLIGPQAEAEMEEVAPELIEDDEQEGEEEPE